TTANNAKTSLEDTADSSINSVTAKTTEATEHVDAKVTEFNQTVEDNGFLSTQILDEELGKLEWQKYKLTNDDGSVMSMPVGTDMNKLGAGLYESSGFINDPLNDEGFYEVIVTESKNSRKVIYATHSYSNRMFVKTFHSGGSEREWKEITGDNTRTWLGTLGTEESGYNSVLDLPPGLYECEIPPDAFEVDAPLDPNGAGYIASIDVYEGNDKRKQIKLVGNYNNVVYHATVHTENEDNPNGNFRGWNRLMNVEEFNAKNDDTGWIEWNTMN